MKLLGSLAIWLAVATVALGQPATSGSLPVPTRPVARGVHPAVVRVVSPERDGMSLGSGTLVAVHGDHGLVVTNWHVVRDAAGTVQVVFPNGFRSPATVLKMDRRWDLAALAIWRPDVEPVRLSSQPPRPGESLTIAGYGGGSYRAITGNCTQYVAPETGQPFEMVELSVAARQGDSGGPILNQRGELAGVLFGSGLGCTSGSYCGRVQRFLATIEGDFNRLSPNPLMIAQQQPRQVATAPEPSSTPWQAPANYWRVVPSSTPPAAAPPQPAASPPVAASIVAQPPAPVASPQPPSAAGSPPAPAAAAAPIAAPAGPVASASTSGASPAPSQPPPDAAVSTLGDQLKTFLAGVGVFAILFHSLRMLATGAEPQAKKKRG